MPKSRTYNAIRNTLFGLGGQAFAAVLGILCRTVFVRLLDENYLGINGLFANILSVLSLMELGIAPAMVYSMYKPLAEKNYDKLSSLLSLYKKAYLSIAAAIAAGDIHRVYPHGIPVCACRHGDFLFLRL